MAAAIAVVAAAAAAEQPSRPDPHRARAARSSVSAPTRRSRSTCAVSCPACPASSSAPTRPAATTSCTRLLGGGNNQDSRLALEIRGHDLDDARRIAQDARVLMEDTPGIADVSIGREEGRPEIAIRVDRPKAAMLGMTVATVANTIQTNVAGHDRRAVPRARQRVPDRRPAARGRSRQIADVGDVLLSTPNGQVIPAKNVMAVNREAGPVPDPSQEHGAHHHASTRRSRSRSAKPSRQCRRASARSACRPTSPSASAPRSRSRQESFHQLPTGADPGRAARLRGDGVAVRVAARPVHHHVLDSRSPASASSGT